MILKAFSVTLFILIIHFVATMLQRASRGFSQQNQGYQYYIGCSEVETNLNQAGKIQSYLVNLSAQIIPYSVSQVKKYQEKIDEKYIKTSTANAIARQFKNYIVAYERSNNLNQYEHMYNRGVRQAREDFFKCRDDFLKEEWDCKQSYLLYMQAQQEFIHLKRNLLVIMEKKFAEEQNIQQLLEAGQRRNQEEYKNYLDNIQRLDQQRIRFQRRLKQKNEALLNLKNHQLKIRYELDLATKHLLECQINKNEIQGCRMVTQRLKEVFSGTELIDIQNRIELKRKIIQKYNLALAKSNKIGQDTSEIRDQLVKNNFQLNKLLELRSEAQIVCSGDFTKKCSDQHILELQRNITEYQEILRSFTILAAEIKLGVQKGQTIIAQLLQLKDEITEDYGNSFGSIGRMRQTQKQNQKILLQYEDILIKIIFEMAPLQTKIMQADKNRMDAIHKLQAITSRVGKLSQCLSKKEYMVKLGNKQAQRRRQDPPKLMKQAAETFIKVLRSAYN